MSHWLVSTKSIHDESIREWKDTTPEKWTAESFLKQAKFYPSKRRRDFKVRDLCLLNVFKSRRLVAAFEIASDPKKDKEGDIFYDLRSIDEWDYPVRTEWLPKHYAGYFKRNPSILLEEHVYHEFIGMKAFVSNLKLDFKNPIVVQMAERTIEKMIVTKKARTRSS